MGATIKDLENCFNKAIADDINYVCVWIKMKGFNDLNLSIHHRENFLKQIERYKELYNENLEFKDYSDIKIVKFLHTNSFNEIDRTRFKRESCAA